MHLNDTIYFTAIKAALQASKAVMEVYKTDFKTELKDDGSPITLADQRANEIICSALQSTGISIISEESPWDDYNIRKRNEYVWLVDPVDGTKEFTQRSGEFTVNIGLIYKQTPVFGIITAPAINHAWIGWVNRGAFKSLDLNNLVQSIANISLPALLDRCIKIKSDTIDHSPILAISRSHLTENTVDMIRQLFVDDKNYSTLRQGSSLKFCLLAEGSAHYYLRADEINEWDTAAGHAILLAAGGALITWPQGKQLLYNKESLINSGFVAFTNPERLNELRLKFPL